VRSRSISANHDRKVCEVVCGVRSEQLLIEKDVSRRPIIEQSVAEFLQLVVRTRER